MTSTKEKRPERGIQFPLGEKKDRSTTAAGKMIIAAAIRGSGAPNCEALGTKCAAEKNWRWNYHKHFMNLVKCSAHSTSAAIGASKAGIDCMYKNFEFVDPENPSRVVPFEEYMNAPATPYNTAVIEGTKRGEGAPLCIPYKGEDLSGQKLKDQLFKWAQYGTIEPDAASFLGNFVDKGAVDLSGQHFVVIGAGSAMGPYTKLLEHGATVIAIDVPITAFPGAKNMWARLINTARNSRGKVIFPISKPQSELSTDEDLCLAAGCNLMEAPAKILAWIKSIAPGKRLTVGNYTYLDSDAHVKLSLAADAIIRELCIANKDTAVAFLCTPTDIHVITEEANKAAKKNSGFRPGKGLEILINLLSFGKLLKKNLLKPVPTEDGGSIYLVDGLSRAQGPNYALAKRLQHWRAMVEYHAGHTVSSNIAPSTKTLSVVSNRSFAWAYGGMPYFKPYEIFEQDTTNAVMEALLVADVTSAESAVRIICFSSYFIYVQVLKICFSG